ncbi:DUF3617 domain-containing protein [Candidatus Nitrosoglobus terrae]|nr:DUF3617 family protein [Candidatus Nitrosoglobus terrae]
MKAITATLGMLGILATTMLPTWAISSNGNLMDLTIHIKQTIAGASALPARTLQKKICMQPGNFDPQAFAKAESRNSCKIEHYQKEGKVVTFDIACTKPEAATSRGVFHLTGGADFTGTTHTTFNTTGRAITIDIDYTGKQVGICPYTPQKPAD